MKTCYIYDNISLNSSCNEKCFRQTLYRKSKHILCLIDFFPKIVPLTRYVEKKAVEPERSQVTI